MFPDECENCGLETDELTDLEMLEGFLHWFICDHCKSELYPHKMKSFKSIAKSIDEINQNEYFYTDQPAKQISAVLSKQKNKKKISTKKCFVIDPKSGNLLDTLTRVERKE